MRGPFHPCASCGRHVGPERACPFCGVLLDPHAAASPESSSTAPFAQAVTYGGPPADIPGLRVESFATPRPGRWPWVVAGVVGLLVLAGAALLVWRSIVAG